MKKIIIIHLICLTCLNSFAYSHAKQDTKDPAIDMLKEFYIAYNTAWSNTHNGYVLIRKLDSLKVKYCTLSLRKELKSEFKKVGLDHDALINDDFTDVAHLNTLKVTIDPSKANNYIVSYIVFAKDVSNNPTQEKIVIHVTVIKEQGSFKIAAVRW